MNKLLAIEAQRYETAVLTVEISPKSVVLDVQIATCLKIGLERFDSSVIDVKLGRTIFDRVKRHLFGRHHMSGSGPVGRIFGLQFKIHKHFALI